MEEILVKSLKKGASFSRLFFAFAFSSLKIFFVGFEIRPFILALPISLDFTCGAFALLKRAFPIKFKIYKGVPQFFRLAKCAK